MYRIELSPGEEALFRNIDELAKAIHTGVISAHARIWHGASNKWLPIDFHPHYKIAKERPVVAPAPAPAPKPAADAAPRPPRRPMRSQVFEPKAPDLDFIDLDAVPPSRPKPVPAPGQVGATVNLELPKPAPAPAPVPPAPPMPPPAIVSLPVAQVLPEPVSIIHEPEPVAREPEPVGRKLEPVARKPEPVAKAPAPYAIEAMLAPASTEPAATPKHIEALVAVAAGVPARRLAEELPEVTIDISAPPSRFSRRNIAIAASAILGVSLLAGLIRSDDKAAPPPPATEEVASTSLAATPATSFEIAANPSAPTPKVEPATATGTGLPLPTTELEPTEAAKPIIPAAPKLGSAKANFSIPSASLTDVSSDAQGELESRLRASGLANPFVTARLQSGQIGSTRLAVAGAANLVRTYRAKATRKESPEGARTADALLADVEALLGVLADHEGSYEISNGTVAFREESLSTTYAALRRRIAARTSAGDAGSVVAATLIQVIGTTPPPALASRN